MISFFGTFSRDMPSGRAECCSSRVSVIDSVRLCMRVCIRSCSSVKCSFLESSLRRAKTTCELRGLCSSHAKTSSAAFFTSGVRVFVADAHASICLMASAKISSGLDDVFSGLSVIGIV